MTPEVAFSHPFISKAVNELKCLRTGAAAEESVPPSAEHEEQKAIEGQKQNNNNKIKDVSQSNGSGASSAQPKTDEVKAPHTARSYQSDSVNVHASLPKIGNRQ